MKLTKLKNQKMGAGTDDIYKPKLQWFSAADSFLNSVISGRTSSSNSVSVYVVAIIIVMK